MDQVPHRLSRGGPRWEGVQQINAVQS